MPAFVLQDDLYAGTKFRPDIRYATILNLLFVVMFFSGGMPVLMPIASLACIITFWLDKYLCTCPPLHTQKRLPQPCS